MVRPSTVRPLAKTLTGIGGLDEITLGGLPGGRPTLVCGGPGCGKTLLAMEFIVRGILQYNEPGVVMTFEERADELGANVASLGFNIEQLQMRKKLRVDYVHVDRTAIDETGEYDLDGLFIRLEDAIDTIGAKRVVLDTIENLFSGLSNEGILRAEIRRLFQWLKARKVTTIVTGERGKDTLTRQGLEEYVSDCVILLEHRVVEKISTRLLRVVKYRGSVHGTNEYPFLIDHDGLSVLPITSLELNYPVSSEKVSSGISALDKMLGDGRGFFRGSVILISGSAGTGKTSICSSFVNAVCKRKQRCLYFAFEESPHQVKRNMKSIGINLDEHERKGLLRFHPSRPGHYGLELHLMEIHKKIDEFDPAAVVVDPMSNLVSVGAGSEVRSMLTRLVDYLQKKQITTMVASLTPEDKGIDHHAQGVSSLVDTWVNIRDIESNGERNLALCVMKSRGMKHSNQVREFIITNEGLNLVEVYLGPAGILTGSARESQHLNERMEEEMRSRALAHKDREIARRREVMEAKVSRLREEFERTSDRLNRRYDEESRRTAYIEKNRREQLKNRHLDDRDRNKAGVKR